MFLKKLLDNLHSVMAAHKALAIGWGGGLGGFCIPKSEQRWEGRKERKKETKKKVCILCNNWWWPGARNPASFSPAQRGLSWRPRPWWWPIQCWRPSLQRNAYVLFGGTATQPSNVHSPSFWLHKITSQISQLLWQCSSFIPDPIQTKSVIFRQCSPFLKQGEAKQGPCLDHGT